MAAQGARRATRSNCGKSWGPKRPRLLSRGAVHSIDRAIERRERQAARREVREALAELSR